jgi:predicted Rdx family selenoprotein
MLTIDDCIALSGLTEAEILAIAEHEHIPFTAAAEMGRCLFCAERGLDTLKLMILDDIWAARKRGDLSHVEELKQTLRDYAATRREKVHAAPYG